MVTRYGGRKEPTMHCFMSHCAHPPPQHPPPPLSQFRIISAANAGRPDVGFHVPGAGFPQQQGGGAGPPTPQLRGIHHPHHGGNPSIPPQQPPPAAQSQHTGGPPGPAPTSTPPGPAEMGKQGPPHMQGQPQMQQGGQVQLSFVPNQTRATSSQPYFQTQRGPAPRISNRTPVVNMQPTNVGQQMFSHQVQVPQMPMFGQQVMPPQIQTSHMFVQSQIPVFGSQTRHQNHTGSGFYQQSPQQVMMAPPIYSSFQHSQPPQYYFQSAVGIPRPGGGVTGAPGPGGLTTAPSQQVITAGGPPTQLGQPGGPVTMGLVQGPVGVPGLAAGDSTGGQATVSVTSGKQTRRKHALDIVDPKTMKNVDIYDGSAASSSTPPRSGDSSARDTPQPNADPGASALAAEFAARVAKVASDKSSPPPPPVAAPAYVESPPTTNGPMNSIPTSEGNEALSLSKQQIVVVEENVTQMTWKQGPTTSSKPSDISNQAAADEKIMDIDSPVAVVEFVPSVSAAEVKIAPVKDSEMTPVVSAQTNAPAVDVVRSSNRDQFPALKSSVPANQSPRRKQPRPETATNVPQSTLVASPVSTLPPASRETTPTTEVKASKKEDTTPPSSTFPISQPPKEKRDQEKSHGRDRDKQSVPSQGRGEREKSVSSTSSTSSTGRDREKSSREKEKAKDRDKSGSQGRDREKSSTKEATPVPLQPQVEPAPQPEEMKQQANGEMTITETSEGKASQRNKPRQRPSKMRDINRKGAEKEGGTEMDAFVEAPPEEVAAPASPSAPAPPQLTAPVPVAAPTNKVTDNQIVEDEDTEADKEEKLVAARNQENAKVTAAALKEDSTSSSTPVIENIPANKPTTLPLKYSYKEDQWSPSNPEGKKKYEREFLMELQNDPQSKKKPDNLPDLEVVLKDNSNRRMGDRQFANMNRPVPDRSTHDNFTPVFLRTHNSRGPTVPKRNSQQGKPKSGKQNVIHVRLSLNDDVKLNETENAWKPTRMKNAGINEQEAKTEELYKKVRGVLNKLTPQKFNTLVSQVQSLPIDSSERLKGVINLVFEKAVDEPSFSVAYAQMCKVLGTMQVPGERKNKDEQPEYMNFRKLLVNRCQSEFEKNTEVNFNREARLKEIDETTDPEKKKELQLTYEEEDRRVRMKSVGNIRFIGELFKLGMLTTNIMNRCIKHLLGDGDEESLECLCKLLTTIGKDLESKHHDLSPCFAKMRDISHKRGEVSSRVRFMLQDVIDLRQNKWIPRRDDSNPKTMDQIQKEAEKEELNQQAILNSAPQTPRRQDDRAPPSRKNRVAGVGAGEDGWNTVTPGRQPRYSVDTSKLKFAPKEESLSLGQMSMHSVWSKGASSNRRDMSSIKPLSGGAGTPYSANIYAALDTSNDDAKRQAPAPISGSRPGPGKAPLASMEKERMLQPFKTTEGENRQARGGASRSSSRDNSLRGGGNEDTTSLRTYAPSSQPPSMSASTEDISGGSKGLATTPAAAAVPKLTDEEVQKKTHNLLEEFLYNTNYKESESLVQEIFSVADHSTFVRETLNDMLERTSSARINVGQLMNHVIKSGAISLSSYISGLNEFLGFADDIAIDVPKFWPYTAEVIVPLLSSETMSFADLRKVAQPTHGNLIAELLDLLVKDKGPGWIRDKWNAAGLKWADFVPEDEVDNFVKRYKLDYVLGGASTVLSASSSTPISWDNVQQKLMQFLDPEQASSTSFDQICEWIGANVGDKVKEPQFIRALMTAICRTGIDSQKTTMKLNEKHLQQHQKLVFKYVDAKEERELQCLYAIQSLINQLEHPQGLLCQIFQVLWDDGTISNDSFITWQDSSDPAEQAGKGVALKSLTTFFTALREGDEDSSCEES